MTRKRVRDQIIASHHSIISYTMYVAPYICGREYSKGNKTVPVKVATTHTEDGHKQDT
jgi:hypothetical protein